MYVVATVCLTESWALDHWKKKKNPISCLFTQIDSFACTSPNLKVWNSLCLLFRMYWCPVFDEGIKEMFIFNRRSLITGARELPVSKLENSGEGNLWSVYLILESSMSKQKSLMTWSKWVCFISSHASCGTVMVKCKLLPLFKKKRLSFRILKAEAVYAGTLSNLSGCSISVRLVCILLTLHFNDWFIILFCLIDSKS